MKKVSKNFNEKIEGIRVCLKRYKASDKNLINQFTKVSIENHDYIFEYAQWDNQLSSEKDILNYVELANKLWEQKSRATYAIVEKPTNRFVGNITLYNVDFKNLSCEIGIWCAKDFKGMGYASEALNLITTNFAKKGITLFKSCVNIKNDASNKLMIRNNFKEVGDSLARFTSVYYKSMKSK